MKTTRAGYAVGVIGTIIVLLWIGLLKFTPSEAAAIKPYIENSFLMSWIYKVGTVQQVSNFVGAFEIITAILLIASFFNRQMGLIGGYLGLVIFLTTLRSSMFHLFMTIYRARGPLNIAPVRRYTQPNTLPYLRAGRSEDQCKQYRPQLFLQSSLFRP